MTTMNETPQEAEDSFYDALEEGNLQQLMSVWSESDDICCLLPMYPLVQGHDAVRDVFSHLFSHGSGVALSINHLHWIEVGDVAIHQVEEILQNVPPDRNPPPPFYGTNVYHKENGGWRLLLHQNSPTPAPAPPEMVMPE
ncbi:MAG TPA: nuclear transport factor 2 family protein [Gammaproteobacteria bacterium]|nr:nuclear transport factor 2 family protein [Gammaproteobacteria bacterium]